MVGTMQSLKLKVFYVNREANRVAHSLAQWTLSIPNLFWFYYDEPDRIKTDKRINHHGRQHTDQLWHTTAFPFFLSSSNSKFASATRLPSFGATVSHRVSMTADWMPDQPRPPYLDGSAPGDFGFDPLRLGEVPENLDSLVYWFPRLWGTLPMISVIEFLTIAFVEHQRSMEKDTEKKYPGGAFDPLGYSKDPKKLFDNVGVRRILCSTISLPGNRTIGKLGDSLGLIHGTTFIIPRSISP
ncbi:Light-harvesting complex I protein Lhca1 isoform 2 [Hibiscus syriacus]|uniref:Chlorophyll a-b binding protein, chloroplastic n=1 Tax=Hibiscus syriacus TaxID=106335 RepID=A0A6A2YH63_HIBSY|nr:Light-harvesting complex I protein Lhca1 isoform 2 [Hibiscus syriacus]